MIRMKDELNDRFFIKVSPNGRWVVAAYSSKVLIWDLAGGNNVELLDLQSNICSMDFNPSDIIISIATEQQIFHVDLSNRQGKIIDHGWQIYKIVYGYDGILYGISSDGIYDLNQLKKLKNDNFGGNMLDIGWLQHTSLGITLIVCIKQDQLQLILPEITLSLNEPFSIEQEDTSTDELETQILKETNERHSILKNRLSLIRQCNVLLKKGKLKEAMEHISQDCTIANTVLNQCLLKEDKLPNYIPVSELKYIVPVIRELLISREKGHVEATLSTLKEILCQYNASLRNGGTNDIVSSLKRLSIPSTLTGNSALMAREIVRHIQAL